MRGSPLLRALLAFLAILALGYPLRRLTVGSEPTGLAVIPTAPAAAETSPPVNEIKMQISFTTPPRNFSIRHLGREVWSDTSGTAVAGKTLQIPYPAEGVEIQFAADFPEGSPLAAARLVLTDPQGDKHEKSCWGTGHIDEVVAFP